MLTYFIFTWALLVLLYFRLTSRLETIMSEFDNVNSALDDLNNATNDVGSALNIVRRQLRDRANEGGATPQQLHDMSTKIGAQVDRLRVLAEDPTNPVPAPLPETVTTPFVHPGFVDPNAVAPGSAVLPSSPETPGVASPESRNALDSSYQGDSSADIDNRNDRSDNRNISGDRGDRDPGYDAAPVPPQDAPPLSAAEVGKIKSRR